MFTESELQFLLDHLPKYDRLQEPLRKEVRRKLQYNLAPYQYRTIVERHATWGSVVNGNPIRPPFYDEAIDVHFDNQSEAMQAVVSPREYAALEHLANLWRR